MIHVEGSDIALYFMILIPQFQFLAFGIFIIYQINWIIRQSIGIRCPLSSLLNLVQIMLQFVLLSLLSLLNNFPSFILALQMFYSFCFQKLLSFYSLLLSFLSIVSRIIFFESLQGLIILLFYHPCNVYEILNFPQFCQLQFQLQQFNSYISFEELKLSIVTSILRNFAQTQGSFYQNSIYNFILFQQLVKLQLKMFSYSSATKNKSLKVTPELIQHLKSTGQLPKRSFKENQNPKQLTNVDIKSGYRNDQGLQKSTKQVKSRIIEQDISKIADSYVLEGNFLKKHEVYEQAMKKDKKKGAVKQKQNFKSGKAIDRKEILKLEYLEKMGFLRPQQKQTLSQYRKIHGGQSLIENKKQPTAPNTITPLNSNHKPVEAHEGHLPFYTPKNVDPKKLPPSYFSNNKFAYPHMMGY